MPESDFDEEPMSFLVRICTRRDQVRRYYPVGGSPNMVEARTMKLRRRFLAERRGRSLLTNLSKGRRATVRAAGNER
jgi:hypothetical protein